MGVVQQKLDIKRIKKELGNVEVNLVKELAKNKDFISYLYIKKNELTPFFEEMYNNGETLVLGDPEWETKVANKDTDLGRNQRIDIHFFNGSSGQTVMNGIGIFSGLKDVQHFPKIIVYALRHNLLSGYDYFVDDMFNNCASLESVDLEVRSFNNDGYLLSGYACALFYGCTNLKEVNLKLPSAVANMSNAFYYCANLETINVSYAYASKYFPFRSEGLRLVQDDYINSDTNGYSSTFNGSYMFNGCTNLKNVKFDIIYKVNLQIGSGTSYGHLLTIESLLSAIQACRYCSSRSFKLTVGSANIEKLANVYVKVIDETDTNYYPFVQCESTDEGAMTIADYMALKNWTIA